jgi:hypothetical protein
MRNLGRDFDIFNVAVMNDGVEKICKSRRIVIISLEKHLPDR